MDFKLQYFVSRSNPVRLGFGFVILLLVLTAIFVMYQTHRTNKIVTSLVEVNNAKITHVIGMREAIRLRVLSISNILATSDEFERDEEIMRFHSYATKYVIARDNLLALPMNETEKALHKQISIAIKAAQPLTVGLVEKASDHEPLAVLQQQEKKSHALREILFQNLNELVKIQQEQDRQALEKIRKLNDEARSVTLSLSLLVLILSFAIATVVSRTVEKKNKALLDAYKDAQAAMQSKSTFLATMSHEIRTPITAIIGFAESTFFSNQTMEMRQNSIKTIIESGKHLLRLINDALDLAKVEAKKLGVEIVDSSLTSIVSGAEHILRPLAEEKSLEFNINYQYPLPSIVKTDPLRLKQIIINLGSNAIKFTSQGYVQIDISFQHEENKLKIEVSDTGIGLEKEQISGIFEPFSQADSSIKRKFGGTGLGLTLSSQLAEALNGKIEVTSEPGKGSCFSLILILNQDIDNTDEDQLTWQTNNKDSSDANEELKNISNIDRMRVTGKVLVVEDNIVNQQLLGVFLSRINAEYEVVENGQLAIDKINEEVFDLILMDIQMPVMDGITATKTLRGQGYTRPIVALTANSSEEDRENCLNAGCNDFLSKPIDIKAFFDMITDHLSFVDDDTESEEPIITVFNMHDPEVVANVKGFVSIHMPNFIREIETGIQQSDWSGLKQKLLEFREVAYKAGYIALIDLTKQMEFQTLNQSQTELNILFNKLNNLAKRITLGVDEVEIRQTK
ncbi:MAG: ATP-binding protein [Gammaproteobacteria bacterium]|nr:ATP-binding protein [Gammaproteobacteria bacterium]